MITVTPTGDTEQAYSLLNANVFAIPPRPALPTGAGGGQVLSTMPQSGTPANIPGQQYTNIPQQWRVQIDLLAHRKSLVLDLGAGLTGVTWANSQAGADTAIAAIRAAIAAA
jgi:hypothetical protein